MRKALIISPSFPPINAADMHRVRQSLPYLRELGWDAVVLAVAPEFTEGHRDPALLESLPPGTSVQHVRALNARWTRKFGLGNLALRAFWYYRSAGDRLLARGGFDLVYFSTTMFPITVLGARWKRRFGVPYVIDFQDPWYKTYYDTRPKSERPPKHWFSSRLNKRLEPIAVSEVGGLISVSEEYCETLRARYDHLRSTICEVIPFGGEERDFSTLDRMKPENPAFTAGDGLCHVAYVGRGGYDFAVAMHAIFGALRDGLREHPDLFGRIRIHLVGTHYSRGGDSARTLQPIAEKLGVAAYVREHPARVPYFTALEVLRQADMLIIPGSGSGGYTASKIYPYILSRRPILAVFNERSSVVGILKETRAGEVVTFADGSPAGEPSLARRVLDAWSSMLRRLPFTPDTDWAAFEPYSARAMTRRQVEVFNRVVGGASAPA